MLFRDPVACFGLPEDTPVAEAEGMARRWLWNTSLDMKEALMMVMFIRHLHGTVLTPAYNAAKIAVGNQTTGSVDLAASIGDTFFFPLNHTHAPVLRQAKYQTGGLLEFAHTLRNHFVKQMGGHDSYLFDGPRENTYGNLLSFFGYAFDHPTSSTNDFSHRWHVKNGYKGFRAMPAVATDTREVLNPHLVASTSVGPLSVVAAPEPPPSPLPINSIITINPYTRPTFMFSIKGSISGASSFSSSSSASTSGGGHAGTSYGRAQTARVPTPGRGNRDNQTPSQASRFQPYGGRGGRTGSGSRGHAAANTTPVQTGAPAAAGPSSTPGNTPASSITLTGAMARAFMEWYHDDNA
jgi:hypothetical protein